MFLKVCTHFTSFPYLKLVSYSVITINEECIAAFACLIDKTHLEKFIDDLEHKLFGVKVVKLVADSLIDVFKRDAS